MSRRLELSRPRPTRGGSEAAMSFALRLLCWYDEQFRRGWFLSDLPAFTPAEQACFAEANAFLKRLSIYHSIAPAGGGIPDDEMMELTAEPPRPAEGPSLPMLTTRRTCSWCHTFNHVGTVAVYCVQCGHRADVPRLHCDCRQCRR